MSKLVAQPFTLPNGLVIKNRLLKSAMSEALGTTDNRVTALLPTLYGRWADGGTGLVVTGNVMIDRRALGEPNNVALEDDRDLELFRAWATAGTRNGTALFMQLNHPGKQAPKGLNVETVSPSAIPFSKELSTFFATPRELTAAEIEEIVARFGRTAKLAKDAGFTGVQIHGAHGYLVSQFLSPHHNRREDAWGGTAEKRRRFVLEVLRSIRAACGPSFPVGIKLNSADFQRGGFTEAESLDTIRALANAGIDFVEISGGTYEAPVMAGRGTSESTRSREAYFLDFAKKARASVKVPLAVTGGFRTTSGMEAALAEGALDFIGIARPLALDPEFSKKVLAGEARSEVRPITTGISMLDKMGMMEVSFYGRQIRRMGNGKEPRPNESALAALLPILGEMVTGTVRTRRLRA